MSNKWDSFKNKEDTKKGEVLVILFTSRNKDNKGVEGFKQRRKSFITSKKPQELEKLFNMFVEEGVNGEVSRMYVSVNSRDLKKVKRDLLLNLIDSDNERDLLHMDSKLAQIAAHSKNALTKKWMLDIDTKDASVLKDTVDYLNYIGVTVEVIIYTPNGWHVILTHGFDSRELIAKHPEISIKRDDMYLYKWDKLEVL